MTLHKATSWSKGVISAEARMANLDCLSGSVQGQERAMTEVKPSRKPMVPQAVYTLWFWTNSRTESEFEESNKSLPSIHQCKWKQVHILKVQKAHHSAKLGQSKWRTWALLSCKYPVANRSNQWTSPLACPKIPNHLCLSCHRNPLLHVTSTHLYFAQICNLGKLMVCKFKGRPVYSSLDVNSQSPDQLFHPGTETRQAAICIKEGSTPVPGSPCRANQTLDLPHKQWQPRKEG